MSKDCRTCVRVLVAMRARVKASTLTRGLSSRDVCALRLGVGHKLLWKSDASV